MPIRQRRPPVEDFANDLIDTLRPSAISKADFIDWASIESNTQKYSNKLSWLESQRGLDDTVFIDVIARKLLNTSETREWITLMFALLGHSSNKTDYAALEGLWRFRDVTTAIDDGDTSQAIEIAEVLRDIGLQHIIEESDDLAAHFRGYKVGMESHKRKNRQGSSFEQALKNELEEIAESLRSNGYDVRLKDEYVTQYQDESGQSKTVDFAMLEAGKPQIVFEANSYTGGGSKPSEVKRAYDRVSTRMRADGIECVWITDGQGWSSSLRNLLKEAYVDFIDLYNFEMVQTELEEDVLNYFNNGPVGSEDEISIPR